MPDEIHFHESPDGTSKQLVCFDGNRSVADAIESLKKLVDFAREKGKFISHIDNSAVISNETGGNPGWGMQIENKRGELALVTFKPIKN